MAFSVTPGTHYIRMSTFPEGPYGWDPQRRPFTVDASGPGVVLTFQLQPARTAAITMVDSAGRRILESCVDVLPVNAQSLCDENDGVVDGVVHYFHLIDTPGLRAEGSVIPLPPGHVPGPPVPLVFDASGHADATYVWDLATGIVAVRTLKPDGTAAPFACFAIYATETSNLPEVMSCDTYDAVLDGLTFFSGVAFGVTPGTHYIRMSTFPDGPYGWDPQRRPFTVDASGPGVVLTFQLQPARTAAITMVDSAGRRILEYCVDVLPR